jgi:hypothetical protein
MGVNVRWIDGLVMPMWQCHKTSCSQYSHRSI